MMLLQESHDCFAEDNSPEWLARIAETERPVLLNPRSPDAWGSAETRLTSLGFGIFSPNGRGIADYGDYLNTTGNVRRRLARSNATRFDLPESLARDRNLLLDNEPPLDSLIGELVTDLDLWLDEGGGYWLRGLALFPYIDPGFTVFLGKALVDGDGRPLLEEARFFDLARLPWLRAGRMPDWLRRALVRGLTPAQLEAATDAIQAFLMPADQPEGEAKIDFSRGKDPRLRKRLLDWLKLTPESLLSDQLLIEALGGRAAEELGLEAPKTLLRHSRSLWASNEARAVAIAAAATIVIGAWQWPTLFPEPTTAQATTETRTPTQGEVAPFEPLFPEEEKEPILDAAGRALDEAGNTSDAGNANADANASNLAGSANDAKDNTNAAKDALEAAADAVERAAEAATTSETEILAGPFVLFLDADTTVITPDTEAALRRIADAYKNEVGSRGNIEPGLVQIIVRIYSNPSDGALGRRLGRSIEDWLTGRGIPPSEIVVQSVGGTVPTKASMVTASAVQRTLRVEISLVANYGKAPTAN
ncbi:MAG TPA: hypothetical protein VMN38_02050 [Sphingomicrobium sp.]|nr:hypothetical protein [Sphingomicrobium sp.]